MDWKTWKLADEWKPSKLLYYWERPEDWEESWRLEETCCHSNSCEKASANANVKNSNNNNNNNNKKSNDNNNNNNNNNNNDNNNKCNTINEVKMIKNRIKTLDII